MVGAREVTDALLRRGGPGPVLLTAPASDALATKGVDSTIVVGRCDWEEQLDAGLRGAFLCSR